MTFLDWIVLLFLAYQFTRRFLNYLSSKRPPSFVALDFETASSAKQSVCQVAMVVVDKGEIIHSQSWLVHPHTAHFSEEMIRIHGITYAMVKGSPRFDKIWPEIEPYVLTYRTVAAHYAHFDIPVLLATLKHYGITPPHFQVLDSCIAARIAWPFLQNHKLSTVAGHLGVELNHHDALSDASAAANILIAAYSKWSFSLFKMSIDTVCDEQEYKNVFFGRKKSQYRRDYGEYDD